MRWPQPGDVFEVSTPWGRLYGQYLWEDKEPPFYGALVRMWAGVADEKDELVGPSDEAETAFIGYFPLRTVLNSNPHYRMVGLRLPVPSALQRRPVDITIYMAGSLIEKTLEVSQADVPTDEVEAWYVSWHS